MVFKTVPNCPVWSVLNHTGLELGQFTIGIRFRHQTDKNLVELDGLARFKVVLDSSAQFCFFF